MHYQRWLRHYDVGSSQSQYNRDPNKECSVPDCDRPYRRNGWCDAHDQRHKKYGDPLAHIPIQERGNGCVDERGYRYLSIKGKKILEHRIVMEEILDRSLFPGENVHHKNGNRADNRPENLELWVTKQPIGQRPEDLLAWAYEIIDRYGNNQLGKAS